MRRTLPLPRLDCTESLPRRTAVLSAFLFLFLIASSASAHLAIVRQGDESVDVPESFDHFGQTLITGDFDDDGFDDLVVAAPDDEVNFSGAGSARQGVVSVHYGTALGITHINPQMLTAADPGDDDIFFGAAFAVGDFDNDGVDDLAVGAPGADLPGLSNAGQVFVYKGVAGNGLSGAPTVFSESDGGSFSTFEGQFGFALAAGDFDGDGFDDLAATALHSASSASWVLIFKGSAAGLTSNFSFAISETSLGLPNGNGNRFGFALAAGNFRGDARTDLAVGAPYTAVGAEAEAGQVIVITGDPLTVLDQSSAFLYPGLFFTPQAGQHLGWSLAAGRMWTDNDFDDLAIGAPHYDVGALVDAGRVLVKQFDTGGSTSRELTQDDGSLVSLTGAQFGWSVAVGDLVDASDSSWGKDGRDDLAVGAPSRDVSLDEVVFFGVGTVDVFVAGGGGPDSPGSFNLDARALNDLWFASNEWLGWSLAFGQFDGTDRNHLAIGAPGKMVPAFITPETDIDQAGQVHVFAPWRQPQGRPHRSSVLLDCADRMIYSQRFRQKLTPASTTKALTAYLLCEAIDNNQLDPMTDYTIPDWVANEVNGGTLGLEENEQMSLEDLLRCVILKSGNDCAYEVAHILTGEDNVWLDGAIFQVNMVSVISDFADMMNARAAQLGASARTTFSNPAGRPYGNHWVTAEDMAIISKEIMKNAHLRSLVSLPEAILLRDTPSDGPFLHYLNNGWLDGLLGRDSRSIGIKGGSNGPSLKTGLGAAELDNGRAIAAWFGVPAQSGSNSGLGGDLLKLVADDCTPFDATAVLPIPAPAGFDEPMTQSNLPTDSGQSSCVSGQFFDTEFESRTVELLRGSAAQSTTAMDLRIARTLDFELAPGESREFSVDPMESHDGYVVQNMSNTNTVTLDILQSHPTGLFSPSLPPGDKLTLPGFVAGAPKASGSRAKRMKISVLITNTSSSQRAHLELRELGFHQSVVLGDGIASPASFSVAMESQGPAQVEDVEVCLTGQDPAGGSTVHVSVHATGFSTAAPDDPVPPTPSEALVRGLSSYPNPFNPRATIAFELRRSADVQLNVYDAQGRRVRSLEPRRRLHAGRHESRWDGRDDGGRQVASGVYWFAVETSDRQWSRRVVLLK